MRFCAMRDLGEARTSERVGAVSRTSSAFDAGLVARLLCAGGISLVLWVAAAWAMGLLP